MALRLDPQTAKYAATGFFVLNVAAQTTALLNGSLVAVHEAHLALFSPAPAAIAGYFGTLQLLSAAYLYLLWRGTAGAGSTTDHGLGLSGSDADADAALAHDYAPFFAGVNAALALWALLWGRAWLLLAALAVAAMLVLQAAFVAGVLAHYPLSLAGGGGGVRALAQRPLLVLVHLLAKLGLALAVLDALHNGSIALVPYPDFQPTLVVKVLTAVGFTGLYVVSDLVLGVGLVADALAFAAGQAKYASDGGWTVTLLGLAAGGAVVVAMRNFFVKSSGYQQV